MDVDSPFPAVKRRRTSSPESDSSRPVSREHSLPIRHAQPEQRSRSFSGSRSPSRRPHRSGFSSPYTPHRSYIRSLSRSVSPISATKEPPTPIVPQRTLGYESLTTLPKAHSRGITCAKFSPDGTLLATGSADATINIYSVPPSASSTPAPEFKLLRTLRAHLAGVNALAWSPITSTSTSATSSAKAKHYVLASASDDKSILLWTPLSSDFPILPSPFLGHSNYVSALRFSPKGNMLVSGSYDEAVFLWDVHVGKPMRQLPAHSDPVGGVDFVTDGTMVCSCSTDGLIRVWDSGTGQCLRTLVDEDRKSVVSCIFSPNGRYILAWTLDGCVRLWNYDEGRCVKTYQGHVNKQHNISGCFGTYYLSDGGGDDAAFVVSGSEDGDVVAWDVTTKELLWRGTGHTDVVLDVDHTRTSDGDRGLLVTVGKDRDIRVWMEIVDPKVLQRRRERLKNMVEKGRAAVAAVAGGAVGDKQGVVGGYALEDDDEEVDDDDQEDVDQQIAQMEAEAGHQHRHGEEGDVKIEDVDAAG